MYSIWAQIVCRSSDCCRRPWNVKQFNVSSASSQAGPCSASNPQWQIGKRKYASTCRRMRGDVVRLQEATMTTFFLKAQRASDSALSVVQACSGNRYEIFQRRRIHARPSNKMRKTNKKQTRYSCVFEKCEVCSQILSRGCAWLSLFCLAACEFWITLSVCLGLYLRVFEGLDLMICMSERAASKQERSRRRTLTKISTRRQQQEQQPVFFSRIPTWLLDAPQSMLLALTRS